jgi:hypothetical protein
MLFQQEVSMNPKARTLIFMISFALLLIGISALAAFTLKLTFLQILPFDITFIVTTSIFYFSKNRKIDETDERVKKLNALCFSRSWIATLMALVVFYWLDHYKILELTMQTLIFYIMLVMVASFWLFHFILIRKADAE